MKRSLGRRLRRLADKLDPPPKITIHCGVEPDIDRIIDGIRRSARANGLRAL